jgi:hypothetical protein
MVALASAFDAADELARRLGISRSELYARALARELAAEGDALITSRLDEVYADVDSSLDAAVATAQHRVLRSSEW